MRKRAREQISYLEYMNRENDFQHSDYEEELRMYRYVRNGDPRAVEEARKSFCARKQGHLSDDPLMNMKYLFVASITLVMRAAITGGMNNETAYTSSDYYIQQMDRCKTIGEVNRLHEEAVAYFTNHVENLKKDKIYSKTVVRCIDYISRHLNQPVRVADIAARVGKHPDYLSSLFKKETGRTLTEYIMESKLRAAENMLLDSDCSCAMVSAAFAFSSQSYFTKMFRQYTGDTPKKFREKYLQGGVGDAAARHHKGGHGDLELV